jgi:hypothetical protein
MTRSSVLRVVMAERGSEGGPLCKGKLDVIRRRALDSTPHVAVLAPPVAAVPPQPSGSGELRAVLQEHLILLW